MGDEVAKNFPKTTLEISKKMQWKFYEEAFRGVKHLLGKEIRACVHAHDSEVVGSSPTLVISILTNYLGR